MRLHRNSELAVARFWSFVDMSGGPDACWLWTGATNYLGYGRFCPRIHGESIASRIAVVLSGRRFRPGLCACHACDNPPCVNPAHLWIGTDSDNGRDRARKETLRQIVRTSTLSDAALVDLTNLPETTIAAIRYRRIWSHEPPRPHYAILPDDLHVALTRLARHHARIARDAGMPIPIG